MMWVVPKKSGKNGEKRWRMVIDFHQLIEITVGNSYPLPLTTDIIESVATVQYITAIDLKTGFYRIPIDPEDAHKTAFAELYGHCEYTRMGMGLRNAPATFQGLMDLVLSGLQGVELYVYLDDIIVFATNLEEHGKKFRRLMKRLDDANLTIEPSKCQFLQREASFLGHIAGNGKIRPDPKKIEAVRNFPVPTSKKKIKQFLGLEGYYRRFVKGFAKIAWPLSNLLKEHDHTGKQPFVWGEAQQQAFEKVKDALCSKPVLMAPDLSKEFIITTDASDFALGAILGQGEIGKDHACQYASRSLRATLFDIRSRTSRYRFCKRTV